MTTTTPSLMDDLERAHEENTAYLWGAALSAFGSLMIPIVGFLAAYFGYKLSTVMRRSWVGYLLAGLGLFSISLSLLYALIVL